MENIATTSKAQISTRVSITWPDSKLEHERTEFEDTDTLVLTFPKYYLDLRISKTPPQELSWAIAGLVRDLPGSTIENPQKEWIHIIDSHGTPNQPDQGSFTKLPNGDALEEGKMINPSSNQVEPYKEVWRRFPIPNKSRILVLESINKYGQSQSEQGSNKKDLDSWKVFVGRIGNLSIAIAQNFIDGSIICNRKLLDVESNRWKSIYQIGNIDDCNSALPDLPTSIDANLVESFNNDTPYSFQERKWFVRECSISI